MTAPEALKIIRSEHAALSALLRSLVLMVRDAKRHNTTPEFRSMRAMLLYIDEFPERLHHVKESTMLFPRLRERTQEADEVLARLDREHHGGVARVRDLAHALTAWEFMGEARREAFETALAHYVAFYSAHMRLEETEVLPLAEKHLLDADWTILDRAFGAHRDAFTGGEPEAPYATLFRTIVTITPAPFGLAAPSASP
jgi:hemerythrin-like domain-containing protein